MSSQQEEKLTRRMLNRNSRDCSVVGRLAALPEDLNSALSTHTGSLELPVTLTPGDGTPPPSFLVHSCIHISCTYIGTHKYINKKILNKDIE